MNFWHLCVLYLAVSILTGCFKLLGSGSQNWDRGRKKGLQERCGQSALSHEASLRVYTRQPKCLFPFSFLLTPCGTFLLLHNIVNVFHFTDNSSKTVFDGYMLFCHFRPTDKVILSLFCITLASINFPSQESIQKLRL